MRITIYVQRSGGQWEAYYYHTDEQRNFYFRSHDDKTAIANAVRATGYHRRDCRVIFI